MQMTNNDLVKQILQLSKVGHVPKIEIFSLKKHVKENLFPKIKFLTSGADTNALRKDWLQISQLKKRKRSWKKKRLSFPVLIWPSSIMKCPRSILLRSSPSGLQSR